MHIYNLMPGVGVGPVRFGMPRAEVRAVMPGEPTSFNKSGQDPYDTDAYHQHGFQISYAGNVPQVDYIELSRGGDFIACYKDSEIFTTTADDLVQYIRQDAPFDEH